MLAACGARAINASRRRLRHGPISCLHPCAASDFFSVKRSSTFYLNNAAMSKMAETAFLRRSGNDRKLALIKVAGTLVLSIDDDGNHRGLRGGDAEWSRGRLRWRG